METKEGWIFAVADYQHPKGIRSLLRYVPHPSGEREVRGKRYMKLDFEDAFRFLRAVRPLWVQDLHVVPFEDISRLYDPNKELPRAAAADPRLKKLVEILQEAGIPKRSMGITGSHLLGLQGPSSDIDFVVYGQEWFSAREAVLQAKAEGRIEELDDAMWKKIYSKRKPEISLQEFVLHERRKGNRGMIDGTYFDLLFTREWDQIEDRLRPPGVSLGPRRIVAQVEEAGFAFDSPSIYNLKGEVDQVLCYSHTYAGQALPGETMEAMGLLEETSQGRRLVVGTTREARGEWIRSLTLLEKSGFKS